MNQIIMTPGSIELNAVTTTTMSGKLRKYSARYGYWSLVPRYVGRLFRASGNIWARQPPGHT